MVIEIERFSSLDRLIRVTAWCRRFVRNCRKKEERKTEAEIDLEEYEDAESLWIKAVQSDMIREQGYDKRKESLGVYEDEK